MKTSVFLQAFILSAFILGCSERGYENVGPPESIEESPATRSDNLLPGNPLDPGARNYDMASAKWIHMDSVSVRVIPLLSEYSVKMYSRQDDEEYVGFRCLLSIHHRYDTITRKLISTVFVNPHTYRKANIAELTDNRIENGYEILTDAATNLIVGAYRYKDGTITAGANIIRSSHDYEKLEDILAGAGFRKTFNENFYYNEDTEYIDSPRREPDIIHDEDCSFEDDKGYKWRCTWSWIEPVRPDDEDHGDLGPDGGGGGQSWYTIGTLWSHSESDTMFTTTGFSPSWFERFSPSLYDVMSYASLYFGGMKSPSFFYEWNMELPSPFPIYDNVSISTKDIEFINNFFSIEISSTYKQSINKGMPCLAIIHDGET